MGRFIDYYESLGVPRSSDDVEVKKAYRRLALKHHPDVDASEEGAAEFAAAAEAYDVLSNPRLKGVYDLYGVQRLKAGAEGEEPFVFDPATGPRRVFERFFGTNNPYEALEVLSSRFEKLTAAKAPVQPQQQTAELSVTLEELHAGCAKAVAHTRLLAAPEGGEAAREAVRLSVDVEAGAAEGTTYTFEGQGDVAAPGQPPGTLSLVLRSAPHARFERRGCDLVHRVTLPLLAALAGGAVPVQTLDGRLLSVPLDEIVAPGTVTRVAGEGLPIPGAPAGAKGDLLVEYDLLFPPNLTLPQKMLLRAALLLPAKPGEAQAKALRAFEAAFKDSRHGWSTGVLPGQQEGGGQ